MSVALKSSDRSHTGNVLDRAGICVSAACLVQCVLLSLSVVLAPVISLGFLGSDGFHRTLLAIIVPLSLAAFLPGYRIHRYRRVLVVGFAGLGFLLAAAVFEATLLPPLAASAVTSVGGLCLIAAHGWNLRLRRLACLGKIEPARPRA